MGAVFLDSSALVKLVVEEPETDALIAFLGTPRSHVLISELAIVEVGRAARRFGADPSSALAECEVILLRTEQLVAAMTIEPTGLRTLDAIHLAAAWSVSDHLDAFVAYDRRLLDAARALGLSVAAPGDPGLP